MAPGLFDAAGTAVLAVAVSLAVHVALNSPIQPVMSPPRSANRYPPNGLLQRLEKLGEGRLSGPEAVYVDAAAGGTVYTATRDGWLQRMHPNGSWENWRFVGGSGLLGIAPSADGSMLVCDADKKMEWQSLSIDLLPHPDMFADAQFNNSSSQDNKRDDDGAKRMFFGGERFLEGI